MTFVIFRTDTTEIVSEKDYSYTGQIHKQESHAKASLTRIKKKFAEGLKNKKPYGTFKFEGLGIHENGLNIVFQTPSLTSCISSLS